MKNNIKATDHRFFIKQKLLKFLFVPLLKSLNMFPVFTILRG